MAINFPDSPVAGTVFGAWRYDGTKWGAVSGVSGGGSAGDITAVFAGAGLSGGGTEGDVTVALAVPVTVARGGTGATDAATALINLGGAPLASPTFTGDPKAPTPATADNDTSVATTAYVKAQGYLTSPVNLTSQVTGTLPVANGGTGATTGNAGPYLPLVGGTVNGTVAITGDLSNTGAITGSGGQLILGPSSGDCYINMQKAPGSYNQIYARSGTSLRWVMQLGDNVAESGSNAGSNFNIMRFSDGGASLGTPLSINRSTGIVAIRGATNASNAGTGEIGEVISSTRLWASAMAITTAVDFDVTTITLTAGDWEITGNIQVSGGTASFTRLYIAANTVSALPDNALFAAYHGSGNPLAGPIPTLRVNVTSPTTVYLHGMTNFTGSGGLAAGFILARRMR